MVREVHSWLEEGNDPFLMVFDNADDPQVGLRKYIPQCAHGRIIITTRNTAHSIHANPRACHSRIGELHHDEAISLLHQLIPVEKRNFPD
jgi:hypothetical protein